MKSDLAKQLLKNIIEPIVGDNEAEAEKIFHELQFFAEYKYDYYEMFAPGRHFLEHLYIWLKQFDKEDRAIALEFVRNKLIFFSRGEFELLSRILYWNIVRNLQLNLTSEQTNIPRYKVNKLTNSPVFKKIERGSLFIGMSDGARIDFFRRQHLSISNEQVLSSYHVDQNKCDDMVKKLKKDTGEKRFGMMFLIDDFCASGSTLIREKKTTREITGTLKQLEKKVFPQRSIVDGKKILVEPKMIESLLSQECKVFLCPLFATKGSVIHLKTMVTKLDSLLKNIQIIPASILDDSLRFSDASTPIGTLCEKYYQKRMGDEHTKDVTFGYKACGLPVVLHHNTPNNSLYILWNRRAVKANESSASFEPLFKRIERHKSNRED